MIPNGKYFGKEYGTECENECECTVVYKFKVNGYTTWLCKKCLNELIEEILEELNKL